MPALTRRDWLKITTVGLGVSSLLTTHGAHAASESEFSFHHDHVIGTSLDVTISASDELLAERANQIILDEIERLRTIFSIYDDGSELSQVNLSDQPVIVSRELADLLSAYETWSERTNGVISSQTGEFRHPTRVRGWSLDSATRQLTRHDDRPFNLNALGKAFIIEKTAHAVRQAIPTINRFLINLGGDIVAVGPNWVVGVQDPDRHFDNAKPLGGARLHNQAIASSGGYERYTVRNGVRQSHIIDPRSGQSAAGVAGATVIAKDCVTANALATSLCILSPAEGLRLVENSPDAECLIVAFDGKSYRSVGLDMQPIVETIAASGTFDDKAWPADFQVTVALELPKIEAKKYRKPYTAVWIEDDAGKAIRTLAVWGNSPKYLKDLSDWWKIGKGDADLVKAVTKATRGPGKYELVWDGKDDKGTAVSQGKYGIRVEVHREHGAHLRQTVKIDCLDKEAKAKMDKNAETAETVVRFGKPE